MNSFFFYVWHHPLLSAVGSALLHSLWQGLLIAVALYLAFRVIPKGAAEVRYTLSCSALSLMVMLPIATAIQIYVSQPVAPTALAQLYDPTSSVIADESGITEEFVLSKSQAQTTVASLKNASIAWRPLLVSGWFLGMLLMSFRWAHGAVMIRRLKKTGLPVFDPKIEYLFDALLHQMSISKSVSLFASMHVDRPMLIGWVKPVVLLPLSLITQLSHAHVEAILAHELAHVRRHDYFVLMLQTVCETLLFYHPAMWWVSRQMRTEREFCCDRLATEVIGDDFVYASALTKIAYRFPANASQALSASDGKLVERIRRIAARNERQPLKPGRRRSSGWGAVLAISGCAIVLAACLNGSQTNPGDTPEELYQAAIEEVKNRNFAIAQGLAERAANENHACACLLLTEIHDPRQGRSQIEGAYWERVSWIGQNDSLATYWAHRYKSALEREAASGNSLAMLHLSLGYQASSNSRMKSWAGFEQSDSLANMWLERAAEANNGYAWRRKAVTTIRQGNVEEANRMFVKAAELGDEAAFWWWANNDTARVVQPDPKRYFSIASLAIENDAPGTRGWLSSTLSGLEREIQKGNTYATEWMAVADSLNISERIQSLPETPHEVFPFPAFRKLCPWEQSWFYDKE